MSLFAVCGIQYMEKRFIPLIFVLFVCFAHILFWVLINQIRINIKSTEWTQAQDENLDDKRVHKETQIIQV